MIFKSVINVKENESTQMVSNTMMIRLRTKVLSVDTIKFVSISAGL